MSGSANTRYAIRRLDGFIASANVEAPEVVVAKFIAALAEVAADLDGLDARLMSLARDKLGDDVMERERKEHE